MTKDFNCFYNIYFSSGVSIHGVSSGFFFSKMILLLFKAFINSVTLKLLHHLPSPTSSISPYTRSLRNSNLQVPAVGVLECNHLPRRSLADGSRPPGTQLRLQRTSASLNELICASVLWDTERCLTRPSELHLSLSKSGRSPFRVHLHYNQPFLLQTPACRPHT